MRVTEEMREEVRDAEVKLSIIRDFIERRGFENTILSLKDEVDYDDIEKADENLKLLLEGELLKKRAEDAGKLELSDIEKVIFSDPYTIVIWADGTKTKVKCGKNDTYTKDAGLAFAIVKKLCGSKREFDTLFEVLTGETKGLEPLPFTNEPVCENGVCETPKKRRVPVKEEA